MYQTNPYAIFSSFIHSQNDFAFILDNTVWVSAFTFPGWLIEWGSKSSWIARWWFVQYIVCNKDDYNRRVYAHDSRGRTQSRFALYINKCIGIYRK